MISYLFSLFLLCCSSTTFTEHIPAYAAPWWSGEKQQYRMGLRHIESGGIGYNNGYTTVDGFVTATPNTTNILPFLDLKAHVFNTGNFASNIGVGIRKILGNRVYGVNSYYDYRNCQHINYNQMGFGIETLGKRVDFRVNAYLPIERNVTALGNPIFAEFNGQHALITQDAQFAMKGMNTNLGVHFGSNKICDFYACAGTYFYAGEIDPHIWGGKASLLVRFRKCLTLEISNSYDKMFLNRFQVSLGLNIPFGTTPDEPMHDSYNDYHDADLLLSRETQPVQRQEIIVLGQNIGSSIALDAGTGEPLRFVFVDNTSNSTGTYESPYHNFAQAQNNSQPGDIIYVFPGDGTTQGMAAGITLKNNQKFWGSGTNQILQTAQGTLIIPAQTSTMPTISNRDIDTEGNAITLSSVNEISGFNIIHAMNDGIIGTNVETLSVNRCNFEDTTTYSIEATFPNQANVSITNNTSEDNVNGTNLIFNGPSTLLISGNTVSGTTSPSSVPFEIASTNNSLVATITNNRITDNEVGTVRFGLNGADVQLTIANNTITNNATGSQSSLGSPIVFINNVAATSNCQLQLTDNNFSDNTGSPLYFHTSGEFNNLQVTATDNTMTDNAAGGFAFATPCTTFTLTATDNIITNGTDNGIAVIAPTITTANITISNNQITGIANSSNGIAINHGGTNLNVTITDNIIDDTEGTAILMYHATPIENVTTTITNNTISNNQNLSSNASGGIDLEQFTNLLATISNNSVSASGNPSVYIGSTATTPTAQVTMSGNTNDTTYSLVNPGDGTFELAPCNVDSINTGTISTSGTITLVTQCPDGEACPA